MMATVEKGLERGQVILKAKRISGGVILFIETPDGDRYDCGLPGCTSRGKATMGAIDKEINGGRPGYRCDACFARYWVKEAGQRITDLMWRDERTRMKYTLIAAGLA